MHGRAAEPVRGVAEDGGIRAGLHPTPNLVKQWPRQLGSWEVLFEDLSDGETLTRGEAPASDLLRVEAGTVFGLLTS